MATKYLSILVGVLLFAISGCGYRAFTEPGLDYEAVDATTITRTLQYFDEQNEGPVYNVSFTVPEAWVGEFETRALGNGISFEFVQALEVEEDEEPEFRYAPIFTVEALSSPQYWKQVGSYPEQFVNIKFTADTYFIYNLPIDAFYSGLPDDEFDEFAAAVPEIIASFEVERVGDSSASLSMSE